MTLSRKKIPTLQSVLVFCPGVRQALVLALRALREAYARGTAVQDAFLTPRLLLHRAREPGTVGREAFPQRSGDFSCRTMGRLPGCSARSSRRAADAVPDARAQRRFCPSRAPSLLRSNPPRAREISPIRTFVHASARRRVQAPSSSAAAATSLAWPEGQNHCKRCLRTYAASSLIHRQCSPTALSPKLCGLPDVAPLPGPREPRASGASCQAVSRGCSPRRSTRRLGHTSLLCRLALGPTRSRECSVPLSTSMAAARMTRSRALRSCASCVLSHLPSRPLCDLVLLAVPRSQCRPTSKAPCKPQLSWHAARQVESGGGGEQSKNERGGGRGAGGAGGGEGGWGGGSSGGGGGGLGRPPQSASPLAMTSMRRSSCQAASVAAASPAVRGKGMRSRRRSSTRKSEEKTDSSGETGLVTKTQAARGPACESNIARSGAFSRDGWFGGKSHLLHAKRVAANRVRSPARRRPQPVQGAWLETTAGGEARQGMR